MTDQIRAQLSRTSLWTDGKPHDKATQSDINQLWYIEFDGWNGLYQFIKEAKHDGPYKENTFIVKALEDDPTGATISLEIYDYYRE